MNIYETVTQRILTQLEAGHVPWHKSWTAGVPKSFTTAKEYRGVNVLMLASSGFTSRYWVTYREALRLGGHVRQGERATPVIYWKWRTQEEMRKLAERTQGNIAPCVPFGSCVFNLDQVEGVARPEDDVTPDHDRRLTLADTLLTTMPDRPQIEHQHLQTPHYSPLRDCVTLPHLSQFENAEAYYSVLYHELTHASGHPRRLNRFDLAAVDRLQGYSFEELVAEFGAAFLCAFTGITRPEQQTQHAGYIEGWARVFRGDSRVILRAASAAQRAADYIRGKRPAEETSPLAETEAETVHV